jgi:hypothetical protein
VSPLAEKRRSQLRTGDLRAAHDVKRASERRRVTSLQVTIVVEAGDNDRSIPAA